MSKKSPSAKSRKTRAILKQQISILNTIVNEDTQRSEKQTDAPLRHLKIMSYFLSNALTCEKKKEGTVQIDQFVQEKGPYAVTALFIINQGILFLSTAYNRVTPDPAKSPAHPKFVRLLRDQNSGEILTVATDGQKHKIVACNQMPTIKVKDDGRSAKPCF